MTASSFFSFLGKTMALALVADQAYTQTKAAGASSLLQPANFAALLTEVEGAFTPEPPAAPPAA